jgi:hypothetical protein
VVKKGSSSAPAIFQDVSASHLPADPIELYLYTNVDTQRPDVQFHQYQESFYTLQRNFRRSLFPIHSNQWSFRSTTIPLLFSHRHHHHLWPSRCHFSAGNTRRNTCKTTNFKRITVCKRQLRGVNRQTSFSAGNWRIYSWFCVRTGEVNYTQWI